MSYYVWKDVIGPGNAFVREVGPDGELGGVYVVQSDPERVHHWNQTCKQMLRAELSIPVPMEHGGEKAMTQREIEDWKTRHNTGWVVNSRVNPQTGKLQFKLRIDDPDAAKGIKQKTIKMVSPFIEPEFMDGNGRVWRDAIVHCALTNKAVIQPQAGFTRAVAASMRGGVIPAMSAKFRGICCQAVALSSSGGGLMNGERDDDNDEVIDDVNDDEGGEGGERKPPVVEKPNTDGGGAEKPVLNPAADRPVSPELIEALAMHNLYLPEGCKLSELEQMLMVSLGTSALQNGLMDNNDEPEVVDGLDDNEVDLNDDAGQSGAPGGQPEDDEERRRKGQMKEEQLTVPLSRQSGNGQGLIGNPATSRHAKKPQTPAKPQQQVKLSIALQRNAFTGFRQKMVDELDTLLENGQIKPEKHGELVAAINSPSVKLSIGGDGTVSETAGIALSIAAFKEVPKGTFWSAEERSAKYQEHGIPSNLLSPNEMSRDEARRIVDEAWGSGDRRVS